MLSSEALESSKRDSDNWSITMSIHSTPYCTPVSHMHLCIKSISFNLTLFPVCRAMCEPFNVAHFLLRATALSDKLNAGTWSTVMMTRFYIQLWSWLIVFYGRLLIAIRLREVYRAHYCINVKSERVQRPGLDDVVDLGVQGVTQSFFAGGWTF